MKGEMFMSVFSLRTMILLGIAVISLIVLAVIVIVVVVAVSRSNKRNSQYNIQEAVTPQQAEIRKSLGETLRELRSERNMTQEFVAESLGISRQAVSKWENGSSEPSTTNLIAIAKLYGIEPEELLKKLI